MLRQKNTLLVIDHEPKTQRMLEILLPADDFMIESCDAGKKALRQCINLKPDIILIDLNLPDMNGTELITSIREWSNVPILILTARSADSDVVQALELGANDYVTKPFNADVLQARINVCLRKANIKMTGETQINNGLLRMDLARHEVYLGGTLIAFTPKEYNLLRYFMINSGKMLTHREILNDVWGSAHTDDSQYLRVFIGQIREKIEKNPANPTIITTEAGVGYRMESAALTLLPC